MKKVISSSIGEIALKGKNRRYFEDQLMRQMTRALDGLDVERIYKEDGKIYVEAPAENEEQVVNRLRKVFGIVNISPSYRIDKDMEQIGLAAIQITKDRMGADPSIKTFKVESNRSDKSFELKSPEISRKIGGEVLKNVKGLKVDVHTPDHYVHVDVKRDHAYVYSQKIKAYGGMPVGSSGKGLLLLSGGIDSPVAAFMMAKRGVDVHAVHYHSYPFTSERAEEKVKDLASILTRYTGKIKFFSINIFPIQEAISKNCSEREMTILSRRFMMRIAEKLARHNKYQVLITGESLGQVASQTMEGMAAIEAAVDIPILRPLIAMDKVDIIDIAKDIETYETSIIPFVDSCTVFLPKHPVTKPRLKDIEKSEEPLDIEKLVNEAIENMEVFTIE